MEYNIFGDDMQAVRVCLNPGEGVRADTGAMMYMTQAIEMTTQANTSQEGGLMGALSSGVKRVLAGENFFMTIFRAKGSAGEVSFSAPYPGKIVPLNLGETGDMLCQRNAYLCSDENVDISVAFTRKFGAGLFGGEGFILQKLHGNGQAFLHAGGMVVPMDLAPGETLRVDTGCLVAMTSSVDYDIQMVKGLKSMVFGGEGLFFAALTGPGRVFLQTLPFNRMADRLLMAASTRQ